MIVMRWEPEGAAADASVGQVVGLGADAVKAAFAELALAILRAELP
jgi:hypothetical protein